MIRVAFRNLDAGFVAIGAYACVAAFLCSPQLDAQGFDRKQLTVEDPRPVAKAVETLTNTYQTVVITYEDPPYAFDGDINDVTGEVRKDYRAFAPGTAPRVLVPRGGSLSATYSLASPEAQPLDWFETLQNVVDAPVTSGGRFRVERTGDVFHVVPSQVRDSSGRWVATTSILDRPVSLPPQKDVDGLTLLTAIAGAVSKEIGVKVNVGVVPANLLFAYKGSIDMSGLTARDALLRLFDATGAKLRWQLFYGPDIKQYALNIALSAPLEPPVPPILPSPPDDGPSPSPLPPAPNTD